MNSRDSKTWMDRFSVAQKEAGGIKKTARDCVQEGECIPRMCAQEERIGARDLVGRITT